MKYLSYLKLSIVFLNASIFTFDTAELNTHMVLDNISLIWILHIWFGDDNLDVVKAVIQIPLLI